LRSRSLALLNWILQRCLRVREGRGRGRRGKEEEGVGKVRRERSGGEREQSKCRS
jgi:hypothetical protein